MRKISVLMPTYNDAQYITKSLHSIFEQNYNNWELIIVNDGSTDETERLIKSFDDNRIKYIYQENSGQLNALLTGSKYIEGDIVLLFHSDDELAHNRVFSNIIHSFDSHKEMDGLYADYLIIDKNGNQTGILKVPDQIHQTEIIKKVFYHKGDNTVGDTFIVKRDVFNNYVLPNYIYDNTIYYINYKEFKTLNLMKIEPWYKYRVFDENYIHSEVGKFEVSNGCFRTIYKLLSNNYSSGPLLPFSNLFVLKVFRKLKLYRLFTIKKGTSIHVDLARKVYSLWRNELISKQFPDLSIKQIDKILHSINRIGKHSKPLYIDKKEIESIPYLFHGKDVRRFYQAYQAGEMGNLYQLILDSEYDHIIVESEEDKEIVQAILKFYSLFYDVIVERRSDV